MNMQFMKVFYCYLSWQFFLFTLLVSYRLCLRFFSSSSACSRARRQFPLRSGNYVLLFGPLMDRRRTFVPRQVYAFASMRPLHFHQGRAIPSLISGKRAGENLRIDFSSADFVRLVFLYLSKFINLINAT